MTYHDQPSKSPNRREAWPPIALALALLLALFWLLLGSRSNDEPYFVQDQLILSGQPAQIDAVVEALDSRGDLQQGAIRLIQRTVLNALNQLPQGCDLLPAGVDPAQPFVVDRYQITSRDSLERILSAVQQEAASRGFQVTPEPNYLTGRPPVPVDGDPWGAEGSPWGAEGSPSGSAVPAIAIAAFGEQWAMEAINLPPVDQPTQQEPVSKRAVRVGVFDTSPFPTNISQVRIDLVPPLILNVDHPISGEPPARSSKTLNIKDHGLFASGLVHAVAQQSEIHLIRVLDDTGQGDLQTLNDALIAFIDQALQDEQRAKGHVINLSLGIHTSPDERDAQLPDEVRSLETILATARCHNIFVVAASGNDSAPPGPPLPMQKPAEWPSTLGVASSNSEGQLSCFSNLGQVAAPGGDGGLRPRLCKQLIHTCQGQPTCSYGLLSLTLSAPNGYAYWNGTSFAAPLVSGQAALLLETMTDAGAVERQIIDTATEHPSTGPSAAVKVINLAASMP